MDTKIAKIKTIETPEGRVVSPESLKDLQEAGEILQAGGLVAFPTETVYGLGGDAFSPEASAKIYAAKGRPSDNPLIVHIYRMEDLARLCSKVPDSAYALADAFWPGPLTMILPKAEAVPDQTTGGLPTVAVRMPSDPVAAKLIEYAGGYVAAPSANLSGRPSPTRFSYVEEDLMGRVDMLLDGGDNEIGLESTIVDLTTEPPQILRPGYITPAMLSEVLGEEIGLDPALAHPEKDLRPRAPGMKYRHYAPKGEMAIVEGSPEAVTEKINALAKQAAQAGEKVAVLCKKGRAPLYEAEYVVPAGEGDDLESIARGLYAALRSFDDLGATKIYSESFASEGDAGSEEAGFYEAVRNRLMKAAGQNVIWAG